MAEEKVIIMRKHETLISFLMTIQPRKGKKMSSRKNKIIPRQKINLITFSFYFYYFYNAFFSSQELQTTAVIYHNTALNNGFGGQNIPSNQITLDLVTNQWGAGSTLNFSQNNVAADDTITLRNPQNESKCQYNRWIPLRDSQLKQRIFETIDKIWLKLLFR